VTNGLAEQEIRQRLAVLRDARGALDAAIEARVGGPDQLQLARMKRRKLRLKDEIIALEGQLIPDIIA
jgi:hypothetical protein